MADTIVLTGGTGVFGRLLTSQLLRHHDVDLILLVRAESSEEALVRVRKIVDTWHDRVQVMRSDLTTENLGLSDQEYSNLAHRTTHILHAAASIRFTHPIEVARHHNVKTTGNILDFAKNCAHLERFGFVSTALVAGNRSGTILEDDFEHTKGFKNTYEQSKYEAEKLVRKNREHVPLTIFRPPLILPSTPERGESRQVTNALSLGINLVVDGDISFLPGTEESVVDIVDGETAALRIVQLVRKHALSHMVYHITNGGLAPSVKMIREILVKNLHRALPVEFCGSMDKYNEKIREMPWYKFRKRYAYRKISSFIPELAYPKTYDNTHTLRELNISHLGPKPVDVLSHTISNIWKSSA